MRGLIGFIAGTLVGAAALWTVGAPSAARDVPSFREASQRPTPQEHAQALRAAASHRDSLGEIVKNDPAAWMWERAENAEKRAQIFRARLFMVCSDIWPTATFSAVNMRQSPTDRQVKCAQALLAPEDELVKIDTAGMP